MSNILASVQPIAVESRTGAVELLLRHRVRTILKKRMPKENYSFATSRPPENPEGMKEIGRDGRIMQFKLPSPLARLAKVSYQSLVIRTISQKPWISWKETGALTICMEFSGGIFGTNGTVYFFR